MHVKDVSSFLGRLRAMTPWWYFLLVCVVAASQCALVFSGYFNPPFWPFADIIYASYCAIVTVAAAVSVYSEYGGFDYHEITY